MHILKSFHLEPTLEKTTKCLNIIFTCVLVFYCCITNFHKLSSLSLAASNNTNSLSQSFHEPGV